MYANKYLGELFMPLHFLSLKVRFMWVIIETGRNYL